MKNRKILKRFSSYYKPYKALFFIDLLCALLIASIDLLYPTVTRYLLQEIIPAGKIRQLFIILLALAGFYLLRTLLDFFVLYWGHVMGVYIESDMRRDLFKHMQKLPFKFYDNNRTGDLMSRVVNDLNEISELAHHGPEDIFMSVIMMVGSFVLLVRIEWRLSILIFCIIFPIILWFTITKRNGMTKAFSKVRGKMSAINSSLENSIAGIRVARAFTNEKLENRRFNKSNRAFKGAKKEAYKNMATYHAGIYFLISLVNIIVLCAGGVLISSGSIDIPDLVAFMLYINLAVQPIKMITNFTQQYEKGMAGFRRFSNLLDEEQVTEDSRDATVLINPKGEISLNNVAFSYDNETHILKDVDLTVNAGTTVAVVGPTGSGKTTLCNLIPRFYEIQQGVISIDGIDIKKLTQESLRKSVGFVQQDVFLFTGTIRENILYGNPDASDRDIIEAAKNAEIDEFIHTLDKGYDTWIGEKGVLLSGGQKQRLSIARAFLKNPPILILDEATSALDNQTERKIQKALDTLCIGRTTLVIAHRLSTVQHADKIVVLTADGIEDQGTHNELFKRDGLYRELYNSQFVL